METKTIRSNLKLYKTCKNFGLLLNFIVINKLSRFPSSSKAQRKKKMTLFCISYSKDLLFLNFVLAFKVKFRSHLMLGSRFYLFFNLKSYEDQFLKMLRIDLRNLY